jgi:single-stranded-DNA-specific exonuclease
MEQDILNEIDFENIQRENKKRNNFIIKTNMNEGLIGIVASRLKDYFNKPVICYYKISNILKGSARFYTII